MAMARVNKWLLLWVMLIVKTAWAQPEEMGMPDNDKIRALRVAFITERLDLSSQEAERFWPVHNEFHKQMRELQDERRKLMMETKEEDLTEAQLEANVQKSFDLEEKSIALKRKYHEEFKKVLPLQKVAALYGTEMEFQRRVLEELHKRKVRRP